MTDSGRAAAGPPRKRRWGRRLGIILAVIFIPLVIGYFVGTSDPFIRKVLLPRVSKAINAQVTAEDTSINLFSRAVLRGVKVQTTGAEPLATVQEARVSYSLWSIIGGNIKVSEMALVSPVVQVITNPDGTSNLDPLTKKKEPRKKEEPKKKDSKPPQVDIGRVQVENAVLRTIQLHANGKRDVTEVSDFDLNIGNVQNGENGSMKLSGKILVDNNPPGTNSTASGTMEGQLGFKLSRELQPELVKGGLQAVIQKAGGGLADFSGFAANIDCDVTPVEVKQVALKFSRNQAALGQLRVHGPMDLARQEGKLNVEVQGIDRQVLNLFGAATGMDFGKTAINSTNQIELAQRGNVINATGGLNVNQFTVTRTNQSTPPVDLRAAYNVSVNRPQQNALVRTFTLNGTQNQKPFLASELTSPMNIAWGGATQNIPDSTLKVAVTDFNFADWKAFLGEIAPAGRLNATMNLASQQSGKRLTFDLNSEADGVAAKVGTNLVQQLALRIQAKGQGSDLNLFTVENYRAEATHGGKPMVLATGSGTFNKETQQSDFKAALEAHLAALAQAMPSRDLKVSSGTLQGQLQVAQKQQAQSVTGNLVMQQLNATKGSNAIQNFAANVELDVQKNGPRTEIRKAAGDLRQGDNPGGKFDARGSLDTEKKSGQLDFKLVDLNQNVLRPFLEPALKGKQLVSVTINADVSTTLRGENDGSVKGSMQVAKLVVNDPLQRVPATPLEAKLQLDASMAKQRLDLRQASVALTPTERAKNEAQLKGQIDMSEPKAIHGKLTLAAESLDVTPYYNLFAGDKPKRKIDEAEDAEPPATVPQAAPQAEPEPTKLPFRDFTADLKIDNLYLRELAISNWIANARIDGSQVSLNPMQMAINGRPAGGSVHLDLGVAGYKFNIAFKADGVPIVPIANSFMADYRVKQGEVFADVQIQGAGTTGASLQKSLDGHLVLTCTNAMVEVLPKWLRTTTRTVAKYFNLPELRSSPMTGFESNIQLGEGKIDVQKLDVATTAFIAHLQGAIPIAKVLTNSPLPKIPVTIALKRSLAEKANLLPANTPEDAAFVQLPTFIRLVGTLSRPKADPDEVVIASIAARRYVLPNLGGDAGKILGNILGGQKPQQQNTNAPASTNRPGAGGLPGLFDILKGREKK